MPTRTLRQQVRAGFPLAVPTQEHLAGLAEEATQRGLHPGNALLMAGVCRDEVCFPFVTRLEHAWGSAFHIGSLGGLLTIGRTGFSAAAHHAPEEPGEPRRYLVVAAAHVGMDGSGSFGYLRREHQHAQSRACGALMAFRDELVTGRLHVGFDPVDPEMSLLRQRVFSALHYGDIPDEVDLTAIVADIIAEDLDDLLAWYTSGPAGDGEAVFVVSTGVLIHTPAGDWFSAAPSRVWPAAG